MSRHIEPPSREINAKRSLLRGTDPFHELGGGDWFVLGRGLRENNIFRPDLRAEGAFQVAILVVLRHGQDIRLEAPEVLQKVESVFGASADHHLVDHLKGLEDPFFVLVGQGGLSLLVSPENLGGGEGDGQEIAKGLGFTEKLHVARMDDVVAAGDKDVSH